jgi:uncharacterized membrane protein
MITYSFTHTHMHAVVPKCSLRALRLDECLLALNFMFPFTSECVCKCVRVCVYVRLLACWITMVWVNCIDKRRRIR